MTYPYTIEVGGISAEETNTPLVAPYYSPDGTLQLHPEEVCLQLHVDDDDMTVREFLSIDRIEGALAQVAHYLDLRQPSLHVERVIGVTHSKMAQIAVKRFEFNLVGDMPPEQFEDDVIETLEVDYDSTPHMVIMNAPDFITRFKTGTPSPDIRIRALLRNVRDDMTGRESSL
jgi:hypothetical protein